MLRSLISSVMLVGVAAFAHAQGRAPADPPTPTDVKPGSITCDECPYPYPSSYLQFTAYGQEMRMAYMDVAPQGAPNGHSVVLFHGMNFAGFYFGSVIDALRAEGFRVIVPDQIGFGRSSKPIIPYHFHAMAYNTKRILDHLNVERVMVVGHSMGGMLAARFATQYPGATERVVIYNPIGVLDGRWQRPWTPVDEGYERNLGATYQSMRAILFRYVSHDPARWNAEFERYARIRYSWTLSGEWPRLAMVQALISQVPYLDPVVDDWAHIQSPTLAFGGAEDSLAGPAAVFQERMRLIADSVPNGNGSVQLIAGLGHVPHVEDPARTFPPLLAFLKAGVN